MLTVHRNSSIEWKPTAVLALATSVDGSQVAAAREDGSVEVWLVSPGSVGWHCHLMLSVHRNSSIEWKPMVVVALATSVNEAQVAAARKDGSVEVWLVSPGSVGWHFHLTIHGNSDSRVSSLVWCRFSTTGSPLGRLFSSSIDGTISEWDLYGLKQKVVLESIGVSIWQMAAAPYSSWPLTKHGPLKKENSQENAQLGIGQVSSSSEKDSCGDSDSESKSDSDSDTSESEDDMDTVELHKQQKTEKPHVALACDDGFVRLYEISDSENLIYLKSMTRVGGRVLSVTWSPDGNFIFSGSSDGFIRCWDSRVSHEKYRITVGLGGSGSGPDLCIWSLLVLRSGTLVSGDSTGSVQFWDSQHGTLLQAHSYHKGDVNALVAVPGHHRICSAGADGQVILYKLSSDSVDNDDDYTSMEVTKRWVHVGCVRAHSHDVRALTVAVPICEEDLLPEEKLKRLRGKDKPVDFSYRKWAHFGVPMLISAGDDTKLFAYSAKEFTQFAPHDICPAPQKVPTQLVLNTVFDQMPLLLIQGSFCLDIYRVRMKNNAATTDLLARVNTKRSRKLICSTISSSGLYFAYSDHVKPSLFQLKKSKKNLWLVNKRKIPSDLPFAHSMTFSSDSSRLILAGHDKRLYVVDVGSGELVHTFTPRVRELNEELPPTEPPITKMYLSPDGQWLAAVNCFGDIYVFNLEIQRQHWFISRLDGASVTAGGFTPKNSNVLIISTSSNQVYAFDVEAKQLGEWSMRHTFVLPRRYQDFPGEVIGLSFPPSPNSSSIIIYSSRAMCLIDFGLPIDKDDDKVLSNGHDPTLKKSQNSPVKGILKRKLKAHDHSRKNFEFCAFRDPVLFVGHLSRNSVLVLDKPWLEVVKTLDTAPVHRHIYGT